MPRRRFPFRLQHADTLFVLLAVLAATALCWVVLSVYRPGTEERVAYTVESQGLRLDQTSATRLLRETVSVNDTARATLVGADFGVTIGVLPIDNQSHSLADAKGLAHRLAERIRSTPWPKSARILPSESDADRLYKLDVLIRDAESRREQYDEQSLRQKLLAEVRIGRLVQERKELAARYADSIADAGVPMRAKVVEHEVARRFDLEKALAITLFSLCAAAAAAHCWRERFGASALTKNAGRPAQFVRPLKGLVFDDPATQHRAA